MKKLLALALVLGFGATAFGATIDLQFEGGATEITLYPSDYAWVEVWMTLGDGDPDMMGVNYNLYGTVYVPPDGDPNFTVNQVEIGPDLGYAGSPEEPRPLDEVNIGLMSELYQSYDIPPYYWHEGPATFLLNRFLIHCTGVISDDVIDFGETNVEYTDTASVTVEFAEINGGIIVHQVPEPGSLALLALGGLALIRRR